MKALVLALGAALLTTPAAAAVINISTANPGDFIGKDRFGNTIALTPSCGYAAPFVCGAGLSYYEANFNFILPANAFATSLLISQFYADDRAIVQLNGTTLIGTGIFSPGNGFIQVAPALANVAYTYTLPNGDAAGPFAGPFVVGANVLRIIVNDTVGGIRGAVGIDGQRLTGMNFRGTISYDLRQDDGEDVPEPATLALLGAGLVGLAAVRRRKTA